MFQAVDRPNRKTSGDPATCPLIPGEQGQWACMGMGYVDTQPNLYLWAAVMGSEGTGFQKQRDLLSALGWIVPFRFQEGRRIVKPVSVLQILLFDPLFLSARVTPWSWQAGEEEGGGRTRLRCWAGWVEKEPDCTGGCSG